MSLTTTTLSAACAAGDTAITVTAATGFAAGSYVQVDNEFMQISLGYNGTATIVPVTRGQNGTAAVAHPTLANATAGTGTDFANASASVVTAYPLSARRRKVESYSAAGAITVPTSGEDLVAIINGTTALAMTLAVPTKDIDGARVSIVSNGKAADTLTVAGGVGADTSFALFTMATGGQQAVELLACNGAWVLTSNVVPTSTWTISPVVPVLTS